MKQDLKKEIVQMLVSLEPLVQSSDAKTPTHSKAQSLSPHFIGMYGIIHGFKIKKKKR